MLVEPEAATNAKVLALRMTAGLMQAFSNRDVLNGLLEIEYDVQRGKPYPAMKKLRALYQFENSILNTEHKGKAA